MQPQKLEAYELVTIIRDLKAVRRAKYSEERDEKVRLEKLKLRLRGVLGDHSDHRNAHP